MVSPCTTFTLPENVASFFLSRISSVAASIWIGWSRFCENPCIALGTFCAELCAPASPPAEGGRKGDRGRAMRDARRQVAVTRKLPMQSFGDHFELADLVDRWPAGGADCPARPARSRAARTVGSVKMVQMHHDIAFEQHDFAAPGNPQPIRGQCSIGQFDVDMFIRGHRALAHVDKGLAETRLITGRGLHEDVLVQVELCSLLSNMPVWASRVTVERSSIRTLARNVLSSTWSGSVKSWVAVFAQIS